MRVFRLLVATLFIGCIATLHVSAQQRQGATPPAASPSPAKGASGPANPVPAKIAFVITDAFKDEKIGIHRWIAAAKRLQVEFAPKEREIQGIVTRIQALTKELETLSASTVVDRKSIVTKQEELARLEREHKFKKDEGEALFKKRYDEVVGPVSTDIGRALDVFAKQRGITLLLEYSRMREIGAILSADNSTDVTSAFIADYNSKNPVTASTAAPAR